MTSTREFFETLVSRVDASKTAGMNNSYLFDIEGAGKWKVDVNDGKVSVSEGGEAADAAAPRLLERRARGSRSPASEPSPRSVLFRGRGRRRSRGPAGVPASDSAG